MGGGWVVWVCVVGGGCVGGGVWVMRGGVSRGCTRPGHDGQGLATQAPQSPPEHPPEAHHNTRAPRAHHRGLPRPLGQNYPSVTLTRISWDLWFGVFGLGSLVRGLWFGIFGLGSLLWDLWFGIFGLYLCFGISGSDRWGNRRTAPEGTIARRPSTSTLSYCMRAL